MSEQEECKKCNDNSDGIYFNFCHIMRNWKNTVGFEFGGLLIDTLVYNHFSENDDYSDSAYGDYLTILQNVFDYLKSQDKNQSYWFAVGSNQQVDNSGGGAFVSKANKASKKIADALESGNDINSVLRELLGNSFPAVQQQLKIPLLRQAAVIEIRNSSLRTCSPLTSGTHYSLTAEYLRMAGAISFSGRS